MKETTSTRLKRLLPTETYVRSTFSKRPPLIAKNMESNSQSLI